MTVSERPRTRPTSRVGPAWPGLYRLAGAAALASAVLLPIQVAVFVIWPPPLDGTATDWFALLRDHRLAGLIDLDLLLVVDNVLLVPILLALYRILRRVRADTMLIATAAGFLGVVMYAAVNPAVQLAALGDQYAAATTGAERATAAAAGEAVLATWQGTAFHVGYLLGSLAGILIGWVMLRSAVFGRVTGWAAMLGNAVGLGLYLPGVGVYIAVFSVIFLEVWYVLVARDLWRYARQVVASGAGRPAG